MAGKGWIFMKSCNSYRSYPNSSEAKNSSVFSINE